MTNEDLSVHIIPRVAHDLDANGGSDSIYASMDEEAGNIGKAFINMQQAREQRQNNFSNGPDAARQPRSDEEMAAEAQWFMGEMEKDN
jgi:hypothetical protein